MSKKMNAIKNQLIAEAARTKGDAITEIDDAIRQLNNAKADIKNDVFSLPSYGK